MRQPRANPQRALTALAYGMGVVHTVSHPLVQHKLSLMRDERTGSKDFRELAGELSLMLAYEAMRGLELCEQPIHTPLSPMQAPMLSGKKLAVVAILRAGLVMSDAITRLVPAARVGHMGMFRNEQTLKPVSYYQKLPPDIAAREVFVVDPMLATGGSAISVLSELKKSGATSLTFLCIVAAPEGVAALQAQHPDVTIYAAAIDSHLNDKGYIVPGLGDAGDRIFGTR